MTQASSSKSAPPNEKYESSSDEHSDSGDGTSLLSEDEWAEERKMSRYIAESELEDNTSTENDDDSEPTRSENPAQMSIGALLKARKKPQQSKVSLSDPKPNQIDRTETSPPSRKKLEHRTNKHAPMVMSSKRSVTRKRTVVEIPKLERRDPRFDSLSGAVDPELHQRSYGFLRSQRKAELDGLRQAFMIAKKRKTSLPEEELRRMEEALRRAENAEVQREKLEQEREALKKWKASEKVKQQEGKSAFYLKKKDQKDVILADRFEHLSQDKRKLQKAMERKRKKVAGKEKKSMPAKRSRT